MTPNIIQMTLLIVVETYKIMLNNQDRYIIT